MRISVFVAVFVCVLMCVFVYFSRFEQQHVLNRMHHYDEYDWDEQQRELARRDRLEGVSLSLVLVFVCLYVCVLRCAL